MKKKLEADLISIAHRILKLKNRSELVQLHLETQKLYEKLSVLLFVEENFAEVKPTIGYADIQQNLSAIFEKEEEAVAEQQPETPVVPEQEPTVPVPAPEEINEEEDTEAPEAPVEEPLPETAPVNAEAEQEKAIEEEVQPVPVPQASAPVQQEQKPEPTAENLIASEVQKETTFEPLFQITKEEENHVEVLEEPFVAKQEMRQITLEDLLGNVQPEPIFVRAEQVDRTETITTSTNPVNDQETVSKVEVIHTTKTEVVIDPKPSSLNDLLSKSINIGLNDRIGFEKHLFAGSSEDLNRVLSQLSTFNTYQEAFDFIEDMVKPDYNNWEGKDDYSQRFMEIVEKRFS